MSSESSDADPLARRIDSERRFLHDLSNPCAVALGMSERLVEGLEAGEPLTEKDLKRAEKVFSAVGRIRELISERRAELIRLSGEQGVADDPGAR